MKMTISIPDQLGERITEYNEKTGVPKSVLIQMAVTQYLDGQKMMETFPDMLQEMKKMIQSAGKDD